MSGFILKKKATEHGHRLAQNFWDFIRNDVQAWINPQNQGHTLNNWAVAFDAFLCDHNFDDVKAVLHFYIQSWRKDPANTPIYDAPVTFIRHYAVWEQRCQWKSRPIPEEQLEAIMRPLRYESWQCDMDELITAVSKSVYALRTFLIGMGASSLPDHLKRRIRAIFGNINEHVTRHFQQWRQRKMTAVWTAIITHNGIEADVRKFLLNYGYSQTETRQYLTLIHQAITEDKRHDDHRN